VFNGDFVDRGQYSCECILILLAFKLLYPKFLHLNRGNHEARDINSRDGFEKECIQKYNSNVFDLFSDLFAALPLAALLEGDKKVTPPPYLVACSINVYWTTYRHNINNNNPNRYL
jgi:hypothetical protein